MRPPARISTGTGGRPWWPGWSNGAVRLARDLLGQLPQLSLGGAGALTVGHVSQHLAYCDLPAASRACGRGLGLAGRLALSEHAVGLLLAYGHSRHCSVTCGPGMRWARSIYRRWDTVGRLGRGLAPCRGARLSWAALSLFGVVCL